MLAPEVFAARSKGRRMMLAARGYYLRMKRVLLRVLLTYAA
jgi:hypothetical protein